MINLEWVDLESISELKVGDRVRYKRGKFFESDFVIIRNDYDCAFGVEMVEISNPPEWEILKEVEKGDSNDS